MMYVKSLACVLIVVYMKYEENIGEAVEQEEKLCNKVKTKGIYISR